MMSSSAQKGTGEASSAQCPVAKSAVSVLPPALGTGNPGGTPSKTGRAERRSESRKKKQQEMEKAAKAEADRKAKEQAQAAPGGKKK